LTYREAKAYLFSRRQKGMKLGLDQIQNLLERLDHPEKRFHSIHIAGTNGKGSTAAILESILREAGYKTALYTSPHLIDMRERIKIAGKSITEEKVVEILKTLIPHIEATGASFFETLTAMAFLYFAEKKVDVAILETGLGGRLDATNVVVPLLTIITEIGLDHTRILGNNLKSITYEKAGIFKREVPCIAGTKNQKVRRYLVEFAKAKNVPIVFARDAVKLSHIKLSEDGNRFDVAGSSVYKNLTLKLLGRHQIENSILALLAVEWLKNYGWKITEKSVRQGMEKVIWRGRLELLQKNPKLLVDSAHNPLGISNLVRAIKTIFQYDRLILVFGVLEDKNYRKMFQKIAPLAEKIVLTKPLSDRALKPKKLLDMYPEWSDKIEVIPNIKTAWEKAISFAKNSDMICGTGSIYFIGEVLRLWGKDYFLE